MFKYVLIFFGLILGIGTLFTLLCLVADVKRISFLVHIVYILSSIITVIIYYKKTKVTPSRNEAMWFLLFVCLVLFIFIFGLEIYKYFSGSNIFVFNKTSLYSLVGQIVGAIIDMFITVYIPFIITSKILSRKNNV